jgi:hypothetical protein
MLNYLHVFSTHEYEKSGSWKAISPSLFMCVCLCASLVPELFDEFYSYLVFKGWSIIGKNMVNVNILVLERAICRASKTQNCYFLLNGFKDFVWNPVTYEDHFPKQNGISGIFRKTVVRALAAQTCILWSACNDFAHSFQYFLTPPVALGVITLLFLGILKQYWTTNNILFKGMYRDE